MKKTGKKVEIEMLKENTSYPEAIINLNWIKMNLKQIRKRLYRLNFEINTPEWTAPMLCKNLLRSPYGCLRVEEMLDV